MNRLKWIGSKRSSPPVQPADTREAEAGIEALAYLQALLDAASGNVKTRDQLQRICEEQCMEHIAAYIAKYLERVERYERSAYALKQDCSWLAAYGMLYCFAAVRHVFTKRKQEAAHER